MIFLAFQHFKMKYNSLYAMEVKRKMASAEMKLCEYAQSSWFKRAMNELAKNKELTIKGAEKKIGLESDFTEKVDRGIKELSLEDAIKIARFFNTTIDSVLDGGKTEIRIENRYCEDGLASQYFAECINAYAGLLHEKCMNVHFKGIMDDDVAQGKAELSKKEVKLVERYNVHMEEFERRRIQPMDAANCCDEVLINELRKRGFRVEKEG